VAFGPCGFDSHLRHSGSDHACEQHEQREEAVAEPVGIVVPDAMLGEQHGVRFEHLALGRAPVLDAGRVEDEERHVRSRISEPNRLPIEHDDPAVGPRIEDEICPDADPRGSASGSSVELFDHASETRPKPLEDGSNVDRHDDVVGLDELIQGRVEASLSSLWSARVMPDPLCGPRGTPPLRVERGDRLEDPTGVVDRTPFEDVTLPAIAEVLEQQDPATPRVVGGRVVDGRRRSRVDLLVEADLPGALLPQLRARQLRDRR
jgi:hypothetical protein